MIGRILIEMERTTGDRSIVDCIDPDGLLQSVDRRSYVLEAMSDALDHLPSAYRVRALYENTLHTYIGWRTI